MSRGKRKTPDAVTLGFESDCVTVPVEAVLPVRALSASVKSSRKYRQITASGAVRRMRTSLCKDSVADPYATPN
jgi:hypothetical protein